MSFKDWTFVQRESARVPRRQIQQIMETANEDSEEEAVSLMDSAVASLRPLQFRTKRPETEYEGDAPSQSEPWAGEFTTTLEAEADPGYLMDGEEIEDARDLYKMLQSFDQAMLRRGLKGTMRIEKHPTMADDIVREFEGEDRKHRKSWLITMEYYKGKFVVSVRATVNITVS